MPAIVSPRAVAIWQGLVERRVTAAIATIAKGRRDCAADAAADTTGLGGHAGNAPRKGKVVLLLTCHSAERSRLTETSAGGLQLSAPLLF